MFSGISVRATEKTIFAEIEKGIFSDIDANLKIYYKGYKYSKEVLNPECRRCNGGYEILLPNNSKADEYKSVFELAHECIHLIAPVDIENVNYFEEGLATKFQLDFIKRYRQKDENGKTYYDRAVQKLKEEKKYSEALRIIEEIESLAGRTIYDICKELFQEGLIPSFDQITPTILHMITGIEEDAQVLKDATSRFY